MIQKPEQIRSANTDAIRATVYLPPELHAALVKIGQQDQTIPKAGASRARITQSQVIAHACRQYVKKFLKRQ